MSNLKRLLLKETAQVKSPSPTATIPSKVAIQEPSARPGGEDDQLTDDPRPKQRAVRAGLSRGPPQLLTKRDVASLLRLNPWSVDRLRRTDTTFPECVWISGTSPRWRVSDIEQWLSSRPTGGTSPDWRRRKGKANA
jgi:predicted DNA-binding transcriptional regulator AlpA